MSSRNTTKSACLLQEIRDLQIANNSENDTYNQKIVSNLSPIFQESFIYNINPRLFTLNPFGGSINIVNSSAEISTGVISGSAYSINSIKRIQYRYGQGSLCRFSAKWTNQFITSESFVGLGNALDGVFFGFVGTEFCIVHANALDITKIYKNYQWNIDPSPISTNVFNCFEIEFDTRSMKFKVNKDLVHEILNDSSLLPFENPNMPFYATITNGSSSNNISVNIGDCGLFIEGKNVITGVINGIGNQLEGIGNSGPFNVCAIRNDPTYEGKTNRNIVYPKLFLSTGLQIPQFMIVMLVLNPTITGGAWIPTSNSCVSTNIGVGDTITATGGFILVQQYLSTGNHLEIDLNNLNIVLQPSDILAVVARTTGGNGDVGGCITWMADI